MGDMPSIGKKVLILIWDPAGMPSREHGRVRADNIHIGGIAIIDNATEMIGLVMLQHRIAGITACG
jgi:hypothetical protein